MKREKKLTNDIHVLVPQTRILARLICCGMQRFNDELLSLLTDEHYANAAITR